VQITLIREKFSESSTIGRLLVDGEFKCWTLEDFCRENTPGTWHSGMKVPKRTAIPYGNYEVVITFSARFKRALPLLLKVPDFEGIRFHAGNTAEDTEGCILVGQHHKDDKVTNSVVAMSILYLDIKRAIEDEKVFIEIVKTSEEMNEERKTNG